jgi:hypothetical protein
VWIADPTGWSARTSQKIESRQDALQATLWVFIDIFYPPNWGCLKKTEFFNRHALITIAIAECRKIGFVFGRIP